MQYHRHIEKGSAASRSLAVVLLACCAALVIFGIWFAGFGFDVNDEAYQTMNAMNPRINPQAILSSAISHIFGCCFGSSLYSMRVLTFLLTAAAVGCSTIYFYRSSRDSNRAMLLFILLLASALCTPTKSRLIGWDCYAVLFTTLSMLSIARLWDGGGRWNLVLLGLFGACATLSRFPDIVIVPVAILALFLCDDSGRWGGLRKTAGFLAAYMVAMFLMLCLLYAGDPWQWVVSLRENFVSGHDVGRLVGAYIHSGRLDLLDIAMLLVFVFVVSRIRGNVWLRYGAYAALFAVVTCVLFLKIDRMFYSVCRLTTAVTVIMAGIYAMASNRNERWWSISRAIVIVGCCVVPMAGSDGGTFKFMALTSIPVCMALLSHFVPGKRYAEAGLRTTWTILLSTALAMPFFTAAHTTFDGGWLNARHTVDHPLLQGNTTTEARAAEINEMIEEGRRVVPDSPLVIGHNNRRFFSEYLWGSRNELWPHSWDDRIFDDEDKIDLLLEAIRSGAVGDIVFAKYGANDSCDFERNPMRDAIEATGLYRSEDYRWFVVFRRMPSE